MQPLFQMPQKISQLEALQLFGIPKPRAVYPESAQSLAQLAHGLKEAAKQIPAQRHESRLLPAQAQTEATR